jgi:hypothetical protein
MKDLNRDFDMEFTSGKINTQPGIFKFTTMKERRFAQYLQRRRQGSPIRDQEEVANNPDQKIDQDFPGFPHGTAKKKWIKPKTEKEKKEVGLDRFPKNNSGSTIASTSKGKEGN